MYSYVARQPIFDSEHETFGYELLFRDGEQNAYPVHISSDKATSRLVVENFLSIGTNPTNQHLRCFINFPQQAMIDLIPLSLPKEHIVVEVLETCTPNDALLKAVMTLKSRGYKIALDDFEERSEWERFLPFVDFIKLDIMALGLSNACVQMKSLVAKGANCDFIAERIETELEYKIARNAGFTLFQGYFFSKPILSKQKCLMGTQLVALELLKEMSFPEPDFAKIEALFLKDVALSFKLLRFVNSLSTRMEVEVTSFYQALVYLGQVQLKQFVSLVAASYLAGNKPQELHILSMQRAQFCSLMMQHDSLISYHGQSSVVGLFSLLDALLDKPIEEVVSLLPLTTDIKLALTKREGVFGKVLLLEEHFEHGEWNKIEDICEQLELDVKWVAKQLMEAQQWSQRLRMEDAECSV